MGGIPRNSFQQKLNAWTKISVWLGKQEKFVAHVEQHIVSKRCHALLCRLKPVKRRAQLLSVIADESQTNLHAFEALFKHLGHGVQQRGRFALVPCYPWVLFRFFQQEFLPLSHIHTPPIRSITPRAPTCHPNLWRNGRSHFCAAKVCKPASATSSTVFCTYQRRRAQKKIDVIESSFGQGSACAV